MTRLTLRYDNGALLQITFNCSVRTATGYKQGYVNSGEFREDQITVEPVEQDARE
jgi:hypothetical protein